MRPVAAPRRPNRGRWVWRASGLVTAAALAIPGTWLIGNAGEPAGGQGPQMATAAPSRQVTITQPVTTLHVESYGAPIWITGGSVHRVQVTEAVSFVPSFAPQDGPPDVRATVSHGHLTLDAPACADSSCSVGFTVTVPQDVAVTAQSDGGPVTVSGVATANVDSGNGLVHATSITGPLTINSGGGPVNVSGIAGANIDSGGALVGATGVHGPLIVNTQSGPLTVDGLTGPLSADTSGGPLLAQGVAAPAATVNTGGGNAQMEFTGAAGTVTVDTGGGMARIGFTMAPQTVMVSTEGGPAVLTVPGGPYALTANSSDGPQHVGIATNPTARRSITVASGGGPIQIESATGHPHALRVPVVPVPPAKPVLPVKPAPN